MVDSVSFCALKFEELGIIIVDKEKWDSHSILPNRFNNIILSYANSPLLHTEHLTIKTQITAIYV